MFNLFKCVSFSASIDLSASTGEPMQWWTKAGILIMEIHFIGLCSGCSNGSAPLTSGQWCRLGLISCGRNYTYTYTLWVCIYHSQVLLIWYPTRVIGNQLVNNRQIMQTDLDAVINLIRCFVCHHRSEFTRVIALISMIELQAGVFDWRAIAVQRPWL